MIISIQIVCALLLIHSSEAFVSQFGDDFILSSRQSTRRHYRSFLLHYSRRARQADESDRHALAKDATAVQPEILSSNFWGTVTRKQQQSSTTLPHVPTLDQDGPLPEGAYFRSQSSSQERCRMGVALDIPSLWVNLKEERIESNQVVAKLQDYVESGFQTFHLRCQTAEHQRWAETNILGKFNRQTPFFCRNQCHFTIPYSIPAQEMTGTTAQQSQMIRQSISEILDRTDAEGIPCLQLRGTSPYFFDILDVLQDMQREGYIQSIDAHQLPMLQQMLAHEYGFSLDAMHWDSNLLDLSKYQGQLNHNRQTKQDKPLILSSPLAGGLMTERYLGQHEMPKSWEFRYMERFYWNTVYDEWAKRRRRSGQATENTKQRRDFPSDHGGEDTDMDNDTLWTMYQTQVLSSLNRVARKHSVSISSVVLRWMLQLEKVSGAIVTCQLLYPDDGLVRKPREQQLRQVFTFALDEEDMNELWEITGLEKQGSEPEGLDLMEEMEEGSGGLFIPSKKRRR